MQTDNLKLKKFDLTAEANDTMNVETYFNDNWDKIDADAQQKKVQLSDHATKISEHTNTIDQHGAEINYLKEEVSDSRSIPFDSDYKAVSSVPYGAKGVFSPEAFGNTVVNLVTNKYNSLYASRCTIVSNPDSVAITFNTDDGFAYLAMRNDVPDFNNAYKPNTYYFASGNFSAFNGVTSAHLTHFGMVEEAYETITQEGRTGSKFKTPSDIYNPYVYIGFKMAGANGSTATVNETMMIEITADEYNNLTVDQLLEKYHYIDGIQSTTSFDIMTRTKNIFNNKMHKNTPDTEVYINGTEITFTTLLDNVRIADGDFLPCKPNTFYKAQGTILSGDATMQLQFFDEHYKNIVDVNAAKGGISPNNAWYVRLRVYRVTAGTCIIENVMIFEGTTASTEYIPYEENISEVRVPEEYPLARLPNDVMNTVDKYGNLHVNTEQLVGFHESTGWYNHTPHEKPNSLFFILPDQLKADDSTAGPGYLSIGNMVFPYNVNINDEDAESFSYWWKDIYVRINKSRLPTSDLDGFETWLQSQGSSKLIYELADDYKRIIPNGHEGFSFPTSIQTWENGDLVIIPKGEVNLDGSFNWNFGIDYDGYKSVKIVRDIFPGIITSGYFNNGHTLRKITGEALKENSVSLGADYFNTAPTHNDLVISISNTDSKWAEDYTPTQQDIKDYFNDNPYLLKYEVDPAYFTYPKITGNIPGNLGTRSKMLEDGLSATNGKIATLKDKLDLLMVLNS